MAGVTFVWVGRSERLMHKLPLHIRVVYQILDFVVIGAVFVQIVLRACCITMLCTDEERMQWLEQFESGLIDVLVSTDLLSRGMDTTFVSGAGVRSRIHVYVWIRTKDRDRQ